MAETTMTTISSPNTGDKYTHIHHKSGLEILVCEMEGFSTTEAMFGTKYGSINTQFKTAADKDYCTVPEGIAHFLEHKLFENEDCDVFDLYAKTGANANAFTSFDKTCYFFSCSDNFKASLEILLSFVQSPYFTPESVAKEQGIIGQEIRMCDDDPGWRVFFNMRSVPETPGTHRHRRHHREHCPDHRRSAVPLLPHLLQSPQHGAGGCRKLHCG